MQLEILELGTRNKFGAAPGSDQRAVFDLPFCGRIWIARRPSGQILAVEKLDCLAPLRLAVFFEVRRSFAENVRIEIINIKVVKAGTLRRIFIDLPVLSPGYFTAVAFHYVLPNRSQASGTIGFSPYTIGPPARLRR